MINGRLQIAPITGYYEYLSQIRQRVNVAPNEKRHDEESNPRNSTLMNPPIVNMENENGRHEASSTLYDEDSSKKLSSIDGKDVTQWTSTEVQQWVEEQCQKFELKKATSEKFQMNGDKQHNSIYTCSFSCFSMNFFKIGQALVLLTKHDFLRRIPDGGEILYYALQKIISIFKDACSNYLFLHIFPFFSFFCE